MDESNLLDPYLLSHFDNTRIYLIQPKFTIGRNPENSHVLDDLRISKVHCEFEKINDGWYLTDKSTNGLLVNREVMSSKLSHMLTNGDIIKFPNHFKYIFVDRNEKKISSVSSKSVEDISSPRNRSKCINTYSNTSKRRHSTTTNMNVLNGNTTNMPSTSKGNSDEAPLMKKRKVQNEAEAEQIDDNLLCVVCTELFIEATTLNCSHSFCKFCIEAWQKKHRNCPVCRTDIIETIPATELDESVTKFFESATTELREERAKVVENRQKQEISVYSDEESNSSYLTSDEDRSDENSDSYTDDDSYSGSVSGSFSGSNSDDDDSLFAYSDDDSDDLLLFTLFLHYYH